MPEEFVSALIGSASVGLPETSRTQIACLWKNPDGTPLLTAAVVSFDGAANLAGEREAQLQETRSGSRFRHIERSRGVVTPILRSDRIKLMIFPNSDQENAVIILSGPPVMGDPDEVRLRRPAVRRCSRESW